MIRKWEERYEAVTPTRFSNGYRGYTKPDIETLIWLKTKVDEGVPIGIAAKEHKRTEVPADEPAAQWQPLPKQPPGMKAYSNMLIEFFLRLDQPGAQQFLDQLLALHHTNFVLMQVLEPALIELGERWERGEISEYQEHFGSHFVRERLLSMKNVYMAQSGSPLLVTACSPGERHELGILFLGYFALQAGFQIAYLGTSPSEKGIFECLEQQRPLAFAFSSSSREGLEESAGFYRELDKGIEQLGLHTKVFIGGSAIVDDSIMPGTRFVYLLSGTAQAAIAKMKRLLAD
ncbi:MerR family transcriptional regulator [Paenibacillus athensensis]|uniref:MerR family transcriptional regulator n=1 Tax=Paenibacillus athensensis TaxID=1967502 RepID=UPI001E485A51|nr:B12-binding domain-containing protein [Paenibacillus athensensis]